MPSPGVAIPDVGRIRLTGGDDLDHRQPVGPGEVQVALVVRRHAHHRAGAVVGQHVVGGVDRDPLVVHRVGRVHAQEHTGLGSVGGLPLDLGGQLGLLQVRLELVALTVRDDRGGQLALGRDHEERRAVQGVRAGGEHGHRLGVPVDLEVHVGALGPADPVALHGQHALRPAALQLGHVVQQPLGVLGGLEVPLGQLPLGDDGAAPLAGPVDDLLVGQHGLVVRAPVDVRGLAVGQPALPELQEQPLGPAVVLGIGGVQPPTPVEAQPVPLERGRLGLDVGVRPLRRVGVVLDRRVLGGQPEGVPADRVQHVVALQLQVPGHDVAHHERLGVTHVQVAGRVREHVQHVAPLRRAVVGRHEGLVLGPVRLPPLLRGGRVVAMLRIDGVGAMLRIDGVVMLVARQLGWARLVDGRRGLLSHVSPRTSCS